MKIQAPQPKAYDGKRDALLIRTFLNNLRTYFKLVRLPDDDEDYKITLAEGYLTGDASYCWSLLPDYQKPTTYDDFELLLKAQFCPADAAMRAKQQLARADTRCQVQIHFYGFHYGLVYDS